MRRHLGTFLALLCALLGLLLLASWLAPRDGVRAHAWVAPTPVVPEVEQVQALPRPSAQSPSNYPAILARPLFLESRRPQAAAPAPAVAASAPPPNPLDNARVLGIATARNTITVMVNADGQTRIMRPGDSLGAWQLVEAGGRKVRFRSGSEERSLELESALLRPSTAASAVPAARPRPGAGR